jgi:peptidoglycan-associated lipoprotein
MGRDTKMNGENTLQRILIGSMIMVALFGFFGCAKKDQVQPGPDEVEVVAAEETVGGPGGPVTGGMEPGLAEESLRAEARAELQGQLQDIYFDFDKYNIRPQGRMILKENYAVLRGEPGVEVLIEGHCDERGTVEYNLALGQRRANAARDFLISLGMDSSQLSTVSYGEERPVDPRNNEEAWAKNRRCHFVILKR